MSVDSKHRVRIVSVNTLDFRSKKTGDPGQMKLAQCIVTSETEDKGEQIVVGELLLPKHLADVTPGDYLADFELSVDMNKRIGARLLSLIPFGQSNPVPVPRQNTAKEADKKAA